MWSSHSLIAEVQERGVGNAWYDSLYVAGILSTIRFYIAYFFGYIIPFFVFYYQIFELFFYHNFLNSHEQLFYIEPTILRIFYETLNPSESIFSIKLFWTDRLWFKGNFLFFLHYSYLPSFAAFLVDGGVAIPPFFEFELENFKGLFDFFAYASRFALLYLNDCFIFFYIFTYKFSFLYQFFNFFIWLLHFAQIFLNLTLGIIEEFFNLLTKFFVVFVDPSVTLHFPKLDAVLLLLSSFLYKIFTFFYILFSLLNLKVFALVLDYLIPVICILYVYILKIEFLFIALFYFSSLNVEALFFDYSLVLFLFKTFYKFLLLVGSFYLYFLLLILHLAVDFGLNGVEFILKFFSENFLLFLGLLLDFSYILFDFFNIFDNFVPFSALTDLKLHFTNSVNALFPAFNYYSIFNINFIPYYISVVLIFILIYNLRFLNSAFNPGRKHYFSLYFVRSLYFRGWFKDRDLLYSKNAGAKLNFLYFNFENFLVAKNLSNNLKLNYLEIPHSNREIVKLMPSSSGLNLNNNSVRFIKLSKVKKLLLFLYRLLYYIELWILINIFKINLTPHPDFKKFLLELKYFFLDLFSINLFLFFYRYLKINFFSTFKKIFSDAYSDSASNHIISYFSTANVVSVPISIFLIFFTSFSDLFYWFGEKKILQLQIQERVMSFLFFSNTHPTASALFSDLFYDKMTFNTRFIGEFFDNTTFWLKFNHNFSTPRIFLYRYLKQIDKKLFPLQIDINRLKFTDHFAPALNEKKRLALSLMRVSEFNYLMFEIFFRTYRDKDEDFANIVSFKYWKDSYDRVVDLLLTKRYFEAGDLLDSSDLYVIFTNMLSDYVDAFTFQVFHGIIFPHFQSMSKVEGKLESMQNSNEYFIDYLINYVSPFNFFQKRPLINKTKPIEKVEPNELFREWIEMNRGMYNFMGRSIGIRTGVSRYFRRLVRKKKHWHKFDVRFTRQLNVFRTFEEISSFPLVFTALDDDLHFRRIIDTFTIDDNFTLPKKFSEIGKNNRLPIYKIERDKHAYDEFGWVIENTTAFWTLGEYKKYRRQFRQKAHPLTDYEYWTKPRTWFNEACYFIDKHTPILDVGFPRLSFSDSESVDVDEQVTGKFFRDDWAYDRPHNWTRKTRKNIFHHYFIDKTFSPPKTRLNPISPNYNYNIPLVGSNDVFRTPVSHIIFLNSVINNGAFLQRHNIYMEIVDMYQNYFGYPEFLDNAYVGTSSYINQLGRRFQNEDKFRKRNIHYENHYVAKMLKTGKVHLVKPLKKIYRPYTAVNRPKYVKVNRDPTYKEFIKSEAVPDWIPFYWKQVDWLHDLVALIKNTKTEFGKEARLKVIKKHSVYFWDGLRTEKSVAFNLDGTVNALAHTDLSHSFDWFFFNSRGKVEAWTLNFFSDLFIYNVFHLYIFPFRDFIFWILSLFFHYRYELNAPQFKAFYSNRSIFSVFNSYDTRYGHSYWYDLFLSDKFIFVLVNLNYGSYKPFDIESMRLPLYNAYYGILVDDCGEYDEYICGVPYQFDDEYYEILDVLEDFWDYAEDYEDFFNMKYPFGLTYGGYTWDSYYYDMYEEIFGYKYFFDVPVELSGVEMREEYDLAAYDIFPTYEQFKTRLKDFELTMPFNVYNGNFGEFFFINFLLYYNKSPSDIFIADPSELEVYNKMGYDEFGYDRDGYNMSGFDMFGYDRYGYDENGYNLIGCDRYGYNRDGNRIFGFSRI